MNSEVLDDVVRAVLYESEPERARPMTTKRGLLIGTLRTPSPASKAID